MIFISSVSTPPPSVSEFLEDSPPCGSSRSCGFPVAWYPSSAEGCPSPPLCPGADGTDAVWRTGGRPSSLTAPRTPAGPASSESGPPSTPSSDSSDAPESPSAAAHRGGVSQYTGKNINITILLILL